jgi:hypothetical protein
MAQIALVCVLVIICGAPGRVRACEPVVTSAELDPAWRAAVATLDAELARRDDIDRCMTIAVERSGGGARVVVTSSDGAIAIRHVDVPDALRPSVLALVLVATPPPVITSEPTELAAADPTVLVASVSQPALDEQHVVDAVELETSGALLHDGSYDGGWIATSARVVRGGAFAGLVSRFQIGGRAPLLPGTVISPAMLPIRAAESIEGGVELGYRITRARFMVSASSELDAIRVINQQNAAALRFAVTGRAPLTRSRRLALYAMGRVGVDTTWDDGIPHAPMHTALSIGAGLAGEVRLWP